MKRRRLLLTLLALSALCVLFTVLVLQWKPMVLYFWLGEARKLVGEWEVVEHSAKVAHGSDPVTAPPLVFTVTWEGPTSPGLYRRWSVTEEDNTLKRVRIEDNILIWGVLRWRFHLEEDLLTLRSWSRKELVVVLKRVQESKELPQPHPHGRSPD